MINLAKNKSDLEILFQKYNRKEYLSSDPAQFMHRYKSKEDQEFVAFLASCFAYGRAEQIGKAVGKILLPMGENPFEFIKSWQGDPLWAGFVYRFHRENHLMALLLTLKEVFLEFGSLEDFFHQGLKKAKKGKDQPPALEQVLEWSSSELEKRALRHLPNKADHRGMRFLFCSPKQKSSCKRVLMFLRWMVRCDQVDLGLWKWFSPKDLIIPTDTHIARLSHYLRLRKGKEVAVPNWKMALEITENLRALDLNDPVKFDFALTRLGILNLCKRKYVVEVCSQCSIRSSCRFAC